MGKITHKIYNDSFQLVRELYHMEIQITKWEFLILFGKQLKKLRKDQKLSLRELALRCEVDYSDISKIEKGIRNIQMSTVLELSKGLNIEPKQLFDFEVKSDKDTCV